MRRFLLCLLLTGSLAMEVHAAPCYGTRMPKQREFFSGLQSHAVFKRYLEAEYGKIRSTQHFLLLSLGLCDWLSIDLKGGIGNIKQRPVASAEIDYASGFSGGYGLRLRCLSRKDTRIAFGFQHISVHPDERAIGNVKHEAILDDWQVSLLLSQDIARFSPYIGVKWSRLDYIHKVDGNRKRWMSDLTKSIGAVWGADFSLTEKIWVNVEAQAFDGEAASLSLNYKF